MYIHSLVNNDLWDLACDIAVEKTISELRLRSTNSKRELRQNAIFEKLEKELNVVTAQKIYYWYLDQNISPDKIQELSKLFKADVHDLWHMSEEAAAQALGLGEGNDDKEDGDNQNNESDNDSESSGEGKNSVAISQQEMEQIWSDISEHIQMDIETFSKLQGDQAGSLTQNLREVNREKYDYTEFLKKFAVRGEVMKLDMDEFDYVFYTYGLRTYGNMPLIEPLEYKEVKRIREFVIAIDTSGSTSGNLVQKFIQKTYNILKSTESFFSGINLHIIQCDAEIQEDAVITNQEEFDEYLKTMAIHGQGGTDFRPVFDYVNDLVEKKEFQNLRGLIYFTDGFGDFPINAPEYQTAFVFVDDGYNNYDVPSWAIKLVLQEEEL